MLRWHGGGRLRNGERHDDLHTIIQRVQMEGSPIEFLLDRPSIFDNDSSIELICR